MGLFQRVGDILSANISDLIDWFEDPEKMLRQAIREMEALISETMDGAAKSIATEKILVKDLASEEQVLKEWQEKAAKAVEAGDGQRARKAVVLKLEQERLVKSLKEELAATEEATRILRAQIAAMKAKLAEAKRKSFTLSARKRAALSRKRASAAPGGRKSAPFLKFDRMREKIEREEKEAEAMARLHTGDWEALAEEKSESAEDALVEEELSRLKGKAQN